MTKEILILGPKVRVYDKQVFNEFLDLSDKCESFFANEKQNQLSRQLRENEYKFTSDYYKGNVIG